MIYFFAYDIVSKNYIKYTFKVEEKELQPIDYFDEKKNKITTMQAFCLNQKNSDLMYYGKKEVYDIVVFTGHLNGDINKITGFTDSAEFDKKLFTNFKKKVEFLVSFQKKYLLVFLEDGFIHQVDIQDSMIVKTV